MKKLKLKLNDKIIVCDIVKWSYDFNNFYVSLVDYNGKRYRMYINDEMFEAQIINSKRKFIDISKYDLLPIHSKTSN